MLQHSSGRLHATAVVTAAAAGDGRTVLLLLLLLLLWLRHSFAGSGTLTAATDLLVLVLLVLHGRHLLPDATVSST
jgi:hypothetical protein